MAHDVFISYSSKDKPTADAVCAGLETRGVRCWIAPRDVLTTSLRSTDWTPAIIDAIRHTKLLVLVYSANANASDQVRRELHSAMRNNVPILPFRIEDVPVSAKLEWYLDLPHWLDALTPPLEKHIEELASTARMLVDRLTEQDEGTDEDDGRQEHSDPEQKEAHERQAAADARVAEARHAMEESRYDDARQLAGAALELDPSHREANLVREAADRLIEVERQLAEARAAREATRAKADSDSSGQRTLGEDDSPSGERDATTKVEAARTPVDQGTAFVRDHRALVLGLAAGVIFLVAVGLVAADRAGIWASPRPIELDQPVFSTLSGGRGANERWQLRLSSADDVRIELSNLAVDYDLFVSGPGVQQSSEKADTANDEVMLTGARPGTYTIEVRALSQTNSQPYRLVALRGATANATATAIAAVSSTLSNPFLASGLSAFATPTPVFRFCLPSVLPCPLTLGQSITEVLTSNTGDRWYVELSETTDLSIALTELPADYDLFVTGPAGINQSSTASSRADDVVAIPGAPPGRYEIAVRPALFVNPTNAPYRLTVRRGVPSPTATGF